MIDQQPSALFTFMAVLQRHLEGRAGEAYEYRRRVRSGVSPHRSKVAVVLVFQRDGEAFRHTNVVKVDFPLRKRAQADFFERLAARDPGKVERDNDPDTVR